MSDSAHFFAFLSFFSIKIWKCQFFFVSLQRNIKEKVPIDWVLILEKVPIAAAIYCVIEYEIKSGKDYKIHSALDSFLSTAEYNIHKAIVFSNERNVLFENGITYMPIYYSMFLTNVLSEDASLIIPELEVPQL